MSVRLAPSLLASDLGSMARCAREASDAGAELLHFDVMDGAFVPNISFGPAFLKALRPYSRAEFDAHLMIVQPDRYIAEVAEAGAQVITVQVEACMHLQRTLSQIRAAGARAGVALNPGTPLDGLRYVMDDVDMILVMTVNPGFGGQSFLPAMLPKIAEARRMISETGRQIALQVDGGICTPNIRQVVEAGADTVVAGTCIFGHPGGTAAGVAALNAALA